MSASGPNSLIQRISDRLNRVSRTRAFVTHLLISLGIFFLLLTLMLLAWYPDALFQVDGGWRGLRLIVFVDLVLGPSVTLVIFRPGKPGLWFDVLLIAAIQTVALTYGVHVVYSQRPVVMVFVDKKFATATRGQLQRAQGLLEKNGIRADLPDTGLFSGPQMFGVAEYPELERRLVESARALRGDLPADFLRLDRYRPITEVLTEVARDALDMQKLIARSPADRSEFERFLNKRDRPAGDFLFVHLVPRDERQVIALDRGTGELAGYLDIRPPR
ncbi:MAG: hypothetical protein LJE84_04985 [Gammaproteobacteria bacterium]|nr:hypothetical protein [Gammaproteobacteria bacterium]